VKWQDWEAAAQHEAARLTSFEILDLMLNTLSTILVALVALDHFYFMYLEMFAWTTPRVRGIFSTTPEFAKQSKQLAANQGLYNGFLGVGLVWGLLYPDQQVGLQIQAFFLTCILIAAIYGGITVKRSILLAQGAPAAIALVAVLVRWFM
jgi:putative membrane protein